MPDVTLWSVIQANIGQALAAFGGIVAVTSALVGWAGSHFSARWLASQKAELDGDLARRKSELDNTADRLKAELSKEGETHKLTLRKQELLFNKQLDAAMEFAAILRNLGSKEKLKDRKAAGHNEATAALFNYLRDEIDCFNARYWSIFPPEMRSRLDRLFEASVSVSFTARTPDFDPGEEAFAAEASRLVADVFSIEEAIAALIRSEPPPIM